MAEKMSVLVLILSSCPYLRSAIVRFPLDSTLLLAPVTFKYRFICLGFWLVAPLNVHYCTTEKEEEKLVNSSSSGEPLRWKVGFPCVLSCTQHIWKTIMGRHKSAVLTFPASHINWFYIVPLRHSFRYRVEDRCAHFFRDFKSKIAVLENWQTISTISNFIPNWPYYLQLAILNWQLG